MDIVTWAQNNLPSQLQNQQTLVFFQGIDQVVFGNITTLIQDLHTEYSIDLKERKYFFMDGDVHIVIRWKYIDSILGEKDIGETVIILNVSNLNIHIEGSLNINVFELLFTSKHLIDFKSIISNLTFRIKGLFQKILAQFQKDTSQQGSQNTQSNQQQNQSSGYSVPKFSAFPSQSIDPTTTQAPVMGKIGSNFGFSPSIPQKKSFNPTGFSSANFNRKTQFKQPSTQQPPQNNTPQPQQPPQNIEPKQVKEEDLDLFDGEPTKKDALPNLPKIPKMGLSAVRSGNKNRK